MPVYRDGADDVTQRRTAGVYTFTQTAAQSGGISRLETRLFSSEN